MLRYLVYRIGLTVPLLLGTALLIFLAGHYAPGDPVQVLLGDHYSPEAAAHCPTRTGRQITTPTDSGNPNPPVYADAAACRGAPQPGPRPQ